MKPHSEIIIEVRAELANVFEPEWEETLDVYRAYADLFERFELLRAYLEHTEDQDHRRGHSNTACPPLTRQMCSQYMWAHRAASGSPLHGRLGFGLDCMCGDPQCPENLEAAKEREILSNRDPGDETGS